MSAHWHGPLPAPNDFGGYEAVLPGAANRILSMAERSNETQNGTMEKAVDAEIRLASVGQFMAFAIATACTVVAVVFFALGNEVAGLAFIGFPIIMLVRSFLPDKRPATKPDQE